jgi:hypothetical protein
VGTIREHPPLFARVPTWFVFVSVPVSELIAAVNVGGWLRWEHES